MSETQKRRLEFALRILADGILRGERPDPVDEAELRLLMRDLHGPLEDLAHAAVRIALERDRLPRVVV